MALFSSWRTLSAETPYLCAKVCRVVFSQQQQQLYKALSALDERSLDILQSRYLKEEKTTLHTLAHRCALVVATLTIFQFLKTNS
jgi:DNA-directed RNA polymerase specialized sigma subunit